MTILLLHPGAMGSSLGAALVAGGHSVYWVTDGRSEATRARADADSLTPTPDLESGLRGAEIVLSVCPPAAAPAVAAEVATAGYRGIYVDANAVSPDRGRAVASTVTDAGATAVDAGIIGPPAREGAPTLLYLSGPADAVQAVARPFTGSPVEIIALDAPVGAASATKMAFAAWTKGSTALLLAVRALAEAEGVINGLDHAWDALIPHLHDQLRRGAAGSAPKAWRFEAEMLEIAATFAAANLPSGFHEAAGDIYHRLGDLRDRSDVDLDDVVSRLV